MKNCDRPDLNELLMDYLEGKLTSDQEEEIIAHGQKCGKCQFDMDFRIDLAAATVEIKDELKERFKADFERVQKE